MDVEKFRKNKTSILTREALFFKDGDPNFTGVAIPVNERRYQSIEKLLEELNEKVHLPNGVRNIMTPNGNHHVRWLHEIDDGKQYVCTSTTKIKKIDYASIQKKPRFKIPRPPSSRVYEPFKKKKLFSERRQLKSLTIISKEDNNNTTNVMLTNRVKNIDTLIDEVSEKLGGRVVALTTMEGEPILLLSDLFKNGDCFFAEIGDVCQDKPSSVPISFYKNHSSKLAGSSPNPVTSSSAKLHKQLVKEKSKLKTKKESAKIIPRRKDTSWLLTIKTSNVDNATSDNFAYIALYGKYGKTSEFPLGVPEHSKGYYRDSISEVEIKTTDIGDLYKIRIGHDDNGVALGWHVDTILITNLDTMKEYYFKCNRWFSREKDDGEIMREIPLYKNGKPILPLIEYEVVVYTGAYNDENTNFDIFIVIEGEKGDTGKRYLEVSLDTAFRSKSIDTFSLEAVYLGQVKDVVITAESLSQEEDVAWFAEKIVVRDTASGIEYKFPLISDEKPKTPDIFVNNNNNDSPPFTPSDEKSMSADMSTSSSNISTLPLAPSDLKISSSSVKKDTSVNKSPFLTSSKSNGHATMETGDGIYTSDSSNDIQSISDLYSKTSEPSEKSWNSTKSEATQSEKINEKELDDVSDEFTEENSMHEGIQVMAFSKVTGQALCFNSRSKVVHACGQEKSCCIWTVLDGNIEESVLLYSFQGDGYLSINQNGVTLTKGSPGILNEFYVIISESSETKEISLESVVHSGIFLCSDDYGHVFGTEGQNESTKFLLTHKAHDVPEFSIEDSGCPHFVAPPFWHAQIVDAVSENQNADVEAEEIEEKEKKNQEEEYQVDDRFIDSEKELPSKKKTKKKYKFKKRKKPAKGSEESEIVFKNWLLSFTYQIEGTDSDNCNIRSDGLSGNESDIIEMRLNPEDSSPSLPNCNENISDKFEGSELKREISFDQSLSSNSEEELFIVLRSESVCKTLNDKFEVHQSISDPNLSEMSDKDKIISNGSVNPLDELSSQSPNRFNMNRNSHSFDEENSFDEASIYKSSITADDYNSNEFEGDDESDEYYEWEDERNNMPQPHHFDTPDVLPSRPHSMKLHGTLDRPIIERPHSSPNKYTPLPPIKSYGFSPRTCSVIEADHRPSSSGRSFSVPCEKNTYKDIPKLNKPVSLMASFVSLADVDSNAGDCEVDASVLALSSRASEKCDNDKTPKNSNFLNKPKVQQPNTSVKSWNYTTDNNVDILESSKKLHENDIDSSLANEPLSSSSLVEEPSQSDLFITMSIVSSPSIKSDRDYPWGLFD